MTFLVASIVCAYVSFSLASPDAIEAFQGKTVTYIYEKETEIETVKTEQIFALPHVA